MSDQFFTQTIELFKQFEEVDAIALGGSKVSEWHDAASDYDIYIYLNNELSEEKRRIALIQTCESVNLSRTHWGVHWDDCILRDGIPIEINYMRLDGTRENLRNHLEKHIAWGGYTTCTCFVAFNSKLLHDPHGLYAEMVKQFTMPYPEQLDRKSVV